MLLNSLRKGRDMFLGKDTSERLVELEGVLGVPIIG